MQAMKHRTKRTVLGIGLIYCVLWTLTATWGISDVDRAFDEQFQIGSTQAFANSEPSPKVPIRRIDLMANVKDLRDSRNRFPDRSGLFRYRSGGIAIAPFVIVDEAAATWAPLAGFGGRRLSLWCFGLTRWWLIQTYWSV